MFFVMLLYLQLFLFGLLFSMCIESILWTFDVHCSYLEMIHIFVEKIWLIILGLQKRLASISQDSEKYWEFMGFTGNSLNMALIYPCMQLFSGLNHLYNGNKLLCTLFLTSNCLDVLDLSSFLSIHTTIMCSSTTCIIVRCQGMAL